MTRISEQVFSIDLPGLWEPIDSEEPGGLAYRQQDGPGTLSVMLLSMRPMFAIADKARVLSDYASHRAKFERGRTPSLEQSDPVFANQDEAFEASWQGTDSIAGRQHQHRAVLVDNLLADFCFETSVEDGESFNALAEGVLSTARLLDENGDQKS